MPVGFVIAASVVVSVVVWLLAIRYLFPLQSLDDAQVRNFMLATIACVSFPLVIWRGFSIDRRAKAAEIQTSTDSRRRQSEHFTTSAVMLYKTELSVRLAGIHGLWELAVEYPERYHPNVMQMLCGFVRKPAPLDWEGKLDFYCQRPDLDAMLTLIRQRSDEQFACEKNMRINLSNANLDGVDLRGAMLRKAIFRNTSLQHADLSYAHLQHASFERADLQHARLYKTDLKASSFNESMLEHAWLNHANLHMSTFDRTDLRSVSMRRADVSRTSFIDCQLHGARLSGADCRESRIRNYRYAEHGNGLTPETLRNAAVNGMDIRAWRTKRNDSQPNGFHPAAIFMSAILLKDEKVILPTINRIQINVSKIMSDKQWLAKGGRRL